MEKILTSWPFRTERRRDVTIVLLWGISIATIFAQALFQRATATIYDLAILFVICVAAGAICQDFAKAIFGYIGAMIIGMTILFALTMIPVMTGTVSPPGDQFLIVIWISIIVQQIFPILTLLLFAGSIIGAGLAEHYWY